MDINTVNISAFVPNMTIGIGIDIEQIKRFHNMDLQVDRGFLEKIFVQKELEYCFSRSSSAQHLTARFAAKEAVIKALQPLKKRGVLHRTDIEILIKDEAPFVFIHIPHYDDVKILLSLSHTSDAAVAMVVAEHSPSRSQD